MSWNCLEQFSGTFLPRLCQISNTQNAITCCNGSDYCNLRLRPRLPTEQPTTDPQTTGTVSVVEPYLLNTALIAVTKLVTMHGLRFKFNYVDIIEHLKSVFCIGVSDMSGADCNICFSGMCPF